MEKTVVELFAGVGGFRCGLNKVELVKDKVKENGDWKFVWALNFVFPNEVLHRRLSDS